MYFVLGLLEDVLMNSNYLGEQEDAVLCMY